MSKSETTPLVKKQKSSQVIQEELTPFEKNGILESVFSYQKTGLIGHGGTQKKTTQDVYVYVQEQEPGIFHLQYLNEQNIPTGEVKRISKEELLSNYIPEPSYFAEIVLPAMKKMNKILAKADRHRKNKQYYTAEVEYKKALDVDEENIRAIFGLGLTYLERKDTEKAQTVFVKLVKTKGAFEQQHKHLFNEFGIELRKNHMYPQAAKYYGKAWRYSRDDEHILYNLARTLYEQGKRKLPQKLLTKALTLNEDFQEARDFLTVLKKNP